jgi:hypothetical protein
MCGTGVLSIQTEVLPQDQRRMVLEQAILPVLQGGKIYVQVLMQRSFVLSLRGNVE